uniref:Putative polyketide synthase n=1 Tax=Nocardia brasiliensis TaxID=37326 RepID=A0A060Q349_NOCBR|nr:putative polyketide synthase [Nocardia brasiliensis]
MTAAGVSIVGIGCRISGAASAEEYWRMLHTRPPGAAAGIEPFDHDWFGLSAREHAAMAGPQRLTMTVAVEALDDAGIGYRAPGSSAAVLFGAGAGPADLLSTALDLHGPSLTLDSAQASFLTALGMAVRLLDDASVPFAIVGDVTAPPPNPVSTNEIQANGTEPDHCAVVILQRTADAARDGNRQYAQITEVAFGSNGHAGAAPERVSSAAAPPVATVGELIEAALRVYHGDRPLAPDAAETPAAAAALVRVSVRAGASTYAEVVLRGSQATGADRGYEPPVLIPVTGRDNAELRAQAQRYAMRLERAGAAGASVREFAAATARLIPERTRAVVLAQDRDDAMTQLHALAHGEASTAVLGPSSARRPGRLLFLFSGQSALHVAMGRALAARHRVFAAALAETAETIVAAGGPRSWTPKHGFALAAAGGRAASGAHPSALVVPALFTFQVALTELLSAWGIRPDAVAGHGLGELAAAAVSGALPLADAARIVVQHSRLPAPGSTAAALLTATPEDAAKLIEPLRGQVHLAAVNGPRAVLVTGSARYIDTVIRRAKRRDMFARRLTDDADPHGRTGTVPTGFLDALTDLRPAAPHTPMYSTVRHGAVLTGPAADGRYWAENASGTVQLAAALAHAAVDGVTTVVEIAPQPVLSPAVRAYPDFRDAVYPVATRADEAGDFLACLARLHLDGRPIEWSAQGPFVAAPRRIWRRPRTLPDPQPAEPTLPADDLVDHVVCDTPTVPASFWLRILLRHAGADATVLSDFVVHEQAEFGVLARVHYRALDSAGSLRAEVTDGGALASARLGGDPTPADIVAWMRVVDINRAGRHRMRVVAPAAFYDELQCRRLAYGPRLRVLRGIALGPERAVGLFDAAELHSTATVEGCLQLLAATGYEDAPADAIPLPVGIESAWLSAEPRRTVLEAHAFLRTRSTTGLLGDVIGTDQHGVPCLALSGVRIRFAAPDIPAVDAPRPVERPFSFRQETWQPGGSPGPGPGPTRRARLDHRRLGSGRPAEHRTRRGSAHRSNSTRTRGSAAAGRGGARARTCRTGPGLDRNQFGRCRIRRHCGDGQRGVRRPRAGAAPAGTRGGAPAHRDDRATGTTRPGRGDAAFRRTRDLVRYRRAGAVAATGVRPDGAAGMGRHRYRGRARAVPPAGHRCPRCTGRIAVVHGYFRGTPVRARAPPRTPGHRGYRRNLRGHRRFGRTRFDRGALAARFRRSRRRGAHPGATTDSRTARRMGGPDRGRALRRRRPCGSRQCAQRHPGVRFHHPRRRARGRRRYRRGVRCRHARPVDHDVRAQTARGSQPDRADRRRPDRLRPAVLGHHRCARRAG